MVAILETVEIRRFENVDVNGKGKFELRPVYAHPYEINRVSRISKLYPSSSGVVLGHQGNVKPMDSLNVLISRKHAVLQANPKSKTDPRWHVRNLDKNSTSVNGKTIEDDDAVLLENGDIISIPSAETSTKFESFIFEE